MSSWHSPGSIFNLGHRVLADLFSVDCQIQEKIDGSFFAFGVYDDPVLKEFSADGDLTELKIRSKGAVMIPDAPQAMFRSAVDTVKQIQSQLQVGWMYRGEVLCKPKHNALAYDRVPKGNIILFDILKDDEHYLTYEELKAEGDRLGLEVVPQLYVGRITSAQELRKYLAVVSILGGQNIEGIVIKPLGPRYGPDKKLLMGKFVSEAFKEVHSKSWGESNPTNNDILSRLGEEYGTPARWSKAVQHLREVGRIEDSPRDIGPIIKEIPLDVLKECEEEIKEKLFKYAWPHVARMITRGFPSWYKVQLLAKQFEDIPQEPEGNGLEQTSVFYHRDGDHGVVDRVD